MKLIKIFLLFSLLFISFPQVFGKVGIGIAPASGNYNFTLDGGIINFTVYNSGDSVMVYALTLSGNASNFSRVEPNQLEIKPNSYGKFAVIINPTKEVKEGESYVLIATAKALASGTIGVAAESKVNIYFLGQRKKPYFEDYLIYLSGFFLMFILLLALVYKKFKKRNGGKIIVALLASLSYLYLSVGLSKPVSVETPYLNITEINPGESFEIKANITEVNVEDVTEANMTCYGYGGTEGGNDWDSFTLLNNSLTWRIIDSNILEVSGVITLNTSSIDGTWTCKVYAKNSTNDSSFNLTFFNVRERIGLVVFEESCFFNEGFPGEENKTLDCEGKNYITFMHDGNVNLTVKIKGSNLVGEEEPSWEIGVGNITYTNITLGEEEPLFSEVKLEESERILISSWSRGSYPNKSTNLLYCWLDYPLPLKSQVYRGTIYLIVEKAGS